MLPLSDGVPARRFPVITVALIAASFAVWLFLGLWFLYQLIKANFGLFSSSSNGGGVAFFAHAGGFIFGWIVARALIRAGHIAPRHDNRLPQSSRDQRGHSRKVA